MSGRYKIWSRTWARGFAKLTHLQNVDKDEEILRGASRAASFSPEALYEMDAEHPKDVKLGDSFDTMIHHVASEPFKNVLDAALGSSKVEFLPVKIQNHKKRFADGRFYVVNPLDVIDAIDPVASMATFNKLDPSQIFNMKRAVLKALPADVVVFRPASLTNRIFVREDVAEQLEALKNVVFEDPDEFKG